MMAEMLQAGKVYYTWDACQHKSLSNIFPKIWLFFIPQCLLIKLNEQIMTLSSFVEVLK